MQNMKNVAYIFKIYEVFQKTLGLQRLDMDTSKFEQEYTLRVLLPFALAERMIEKLKRQLNEAFKEENLRAEIFAIENHSEIEIKLFNNKK